MSKRALFLDRDGVINHEVGWLHRAADVRFMDDIFPLCRTAKELGYKLIVVTNQAGIGRGLYTIEDFESLMQWMRAEFLKQGVELDAVYHSPYHPEHGIGEYKREHPDRKPGPGMMLRGQAQFDLDLPQSLLIGDRCTDMQAAAAAGIGQAFLLTGTEGEEECGGEYQVIDSLTTVEHWLRSRG